MPVFADPTCRSTRTVRSSSSDATSALQADSNPQSPCGEDSLVQPRRTSDPLCGGGTAVSGQSSAGHPEQVEIVISLDPDASLSSINSAGSAGSTAKLPQGYALAPPPTLPSPLWSSASPVYHFQTSKFAPSPDSDRSELSKSISARSLNPPSTLFNPSPLSNTPHSRQVVSSECVFARPASIDERRQSSTDSEDDDGGGGGVCCTGSMFRADRGSESTLLLAQHARGRRADVPASLICCTPPRHRHAARVHLPPSPLTVATPPASANSPTDFDVDEFYGPEARLPPTRHNSLRRRNRKAALKNARLDKWMTIDVPDT